MIFNPWEKARDMRKGKLSNNPEHAMRLNNVVKDKRYSFSLEDLNFHINGEPLEEFNERKEHSVPKSSGSNYMIGDFLEGVNDNVQIYIQASNEEEKYRESKRLEMLATGATGIISNKNENDNTLFLDVYTSGEKVFQYSEREGKVNITLSENTSPLEILLLLSSDLKDKIDEGDPLFKRTNYLKVMKELSKQGEYIELEKTISELLKFGVISKDIVNLSERIFKLIK